MQIPDKKELQTDPQVLLIKALKKLWNAVKKETKSLAVLLDDVQNYQPISNYLTIIKNVLSEDTIVKETGFLFILASTTEAWSQFLKKHHPIGRYFTPIIKLKRLTIDQVINVLDRTIEGTGVVFDDIVKARVYEYSEGHPYELQVLCSYLYDNQIQGKVTKDTWETSLNMAVNHLGDVLFDYIYGSASPSEREVLMALADEYEPIESKALTKKVKLKNEMVNRYLNRMVSKKLVIRKERGVFALPDRMFREYIIRRY